MPNQTLKTTVLETKPNGRVSPSAAESAVGNPKAKVERDADGKCSREDTDQEEAVRQRTERKPLWLCTFIANYSNTAFAVTFTCHFIILAVTAVLYFTGQTIFPTNFEVVPVDLHNDPFYLRVRAWRSRRDDNNVNIIRRYVRNVVIPTWTRGQIKETVELFYEVQGGNVLTKSNLQEIESIENSLFNLTDYRQTFCRFDQQQNCTKPISILRFFDGTYGHVDPIFYDPQFSNISMVLHAAENSNETKGILQAHLGKDAVITADIATSDITRSFFLFGWPLDGKGDKHKKIKSYMKSTLVRTLTSLQKSTRTVDLFYYNRMLFYNNVRTQAVLDLYLTFGSLAFIFVFILFHTQSLWITFWAIFSIIACFLATNIVYRFVFGFRYFGFFHILSIFIILGIGADDVFVFYDNWRATDFLKYPSLSHRLSDCYRRAAGAMFVTSLTTMLAFFVSGASPLLAVRTFGLFSGTLVLMNYISVISLFPCVVVIYHKKFKEFQWPCCRPCTKTCVSNIIQFCSTNKVSTKKSTEPTKKHTEENMKKKGLVRRFFGGPYLAVISHKVMGWTIIGVFLALLAVFGYFASTLQPDDQELQVYRSNSNWGKSSQRRLYAFRPTSSDRYVPMYIVWGLKNQDMSSCDLKYVEDAERCRGKVVWDSTFDLASADVQQGMKEICDDLQGMNSSQIEELHVATDPLTGKPQVDCFIDNIQTFFNDNMNTLVKSMNLSTSLVPILKKYTQLPYTKANVQQFMSQLPMIYNMSALPSDFDRYFEIIVTYWLSNGYTYTLTNDFFTYNDMIGESKEAYTRSVNNMKDVIYGSKLRYVAIKINTTMNARTIGHVTGLPILQKWEDYVSVLVKNAPPQLQGGFVCTPEINVWHWLNIQQVLTTSAIRGLVISIAVACPVLILATQHVIIGGLATLCIVCSTVSVVGVIPMAGWKLGVLVSLNLCLVVGLSVDYVVHLAEGYVLSEHRDRRGRARQMLTDVGISVFSGAVTTLGASLFMLFAVIQFYLQFGVFMFCTVGFSILYSLGLFSTVLVHMGPQGDFGSLIPLWRKLGKFCTRLFGRKKSTSEH